MNEPVESLQKQNEKETLNHSSQQKALLTKKQRLAYLTKSGLQLLLGFLIIMLFLSIAKLITHYFEMTFPASILGMILLFISLSLGLIKISWIELTSNLVLKYLALLFIPVGVGLINYFDLIAMHWLVIVMSLFFTTLLTLFLVGHLYQWLAEKEQ